MLRLKQWNIIHACLCLSEKMLNGHWYRKMPAIYEIRNCGHCCCLVSAQTHYIMGTFHIKTMSERLLCSLTIHGFVEWIHTVNENMVY